MLSREYGFARTQITLFIAISILTGVQMQWWFLGICIACLILFTITARGHMIKTQKAVKQYLSASGDESEGHNG
jgi:cell division protein FtsW (lipid II flippase)